MDSKVIDLKKNVFELCNEYPELKNLLAQVGFRDITKPGMLATAGRFMTLPKGANAKKIDFGKVKQSLMDHGYQIKE
ncbi:MAG: DUF1858 domain-containing protein [Clostridiales bacterium]|nr:DUF1858 domain-containing protein [Clostridiales bacterium]